MPGHVSKALTTIAAKGKDVATTPIADPPPVRKRRSVPIEGDTVGERVYMALDVLDTPPIGTLAGILGVKLMEKGGVLSPAEAYSANLLTAMATTGPRGPIGVGIVAIAASIPFLGAALKDGIGALNPFNNVIDADTVTDLIPPTSGIGLFTRGARWLGWGRPGGLID